MTRALLLEHRTAERAAVVLPVDVWEGREKRRVFAKDAAPGGLCVVDGAMRDGYVTIGVTLQDGARFTALCRVAWRDGARAGLAFVDAPAFAASLFSRRPS